MSPLLKFLPKQRRTGLFSATQTESIEQLMRAGLRNPVRIRVKVENAITKTLQTLPEKLSSFYSTVPLDRKLDALVWFLQQHPTEKVIVYFLTCSTVDYMYKVLSGLPELDALQMLSFHGKIPSKKRTKLLDRFSSLPNGGVLFVTDVAARGTPSKNKTQHKYEPDTMFFLVVLTTGIDFPNVDWVVQWDAPQDPSAFTHRIGRTARMGKSGSGWVLLTEHESAYVDYLVQKKIPAQLLQLPPLDELPFVFDVVRARAVCERELYEKSHEAFVSYVRGYREHVLSFIFELKVKSMCVFIFCAFIHIILQKLDLGLLAKCFCLLRFPAMPELRGRRPESFVPHPTKHSDIPYEDAIRESQRQSKLKVNKIAKLL
jgi:ATP-dependent RNA helicase DDX55/SPB4